MAPRPRIACFHGGGSSAKIYEVQCSGLQRLLQDAFEFVFFEAPFEQGPGPGILPYFNIEQYGPYKSWFSKDSAGRERPDGKGRNPMGENGIDRMVRLIKEKGGGGEWVGCMGFSQGTRMAGGLLLEQMRLKDMGISGLGEGTIEFKFGVLCMGSNAPMVAEMSHRTNMDMINIPTLHLHGLKDVNLENGRKQFAHYFDPTKATLIEIDYHHAMPWLKADVLQLEQGIRNMYP